MKIQLLMCALVVITCTLTAQTTETFTPAADASIGFHDGYDSEDENFEAASHFSAFSQPSAAIEDGENAGWGIINFDLTTIPEGMVVVEATLSLKAFGNGFSVPLGSGHDGANASWLSMVIESWDVSTVTWNTRPEISELGQIDVPASTDPYEDYDIDISTFAQNWIDNPSDNYGFVIRLQVEDPTSGLMFHSSDAAEEDEWPTLTITYEQETAISSQPIGSTSFIVFPDPASDYIMIEATSEFNSTSALIEVYNIGGGKVYEQSINSFTEKIAISDYLPGLYTILVTDENTGNRFTTTFVKQ